MPIHLLRVCALSVICCSREIDCTSYRHTREKEKANGEKIGDEEEANLNG